MMRGYRIAAIGAAFTLVALAVAILGGCAAEQQDVVRSLALGPLATVPIGVFISW